LFKYHGHGSSASEIANIPPDRPEEALTREQAVTAYTLGSDHAEFAD